MIEKIRICFVMVLMLGVLANHDRLHAAQRSTSSHGAAPSKELLQIIALNNKKGKKSAKKSGMLKRMYASTMQMVQLPGNYVFGKKPSTAKKAFYVVLGLTALASASAVYGVYNWPIIKAWLKELLKEEEENNESGNSGDSKSVDTDKIGSDLEQGLPKDPIKPADQQSKPIEKPTEQPKINTDPKPNDDNGTDLKKGKNDNQQNIVVPADTPPKQQINPEIKPTTPPSVSQNGERPTRRILKPRDSKGRLVSQEPEETNPPVVQNSQPKVPEKSSDDSTAQQMGHLLTQDRRIIKFPVTEKSEKISDNNDETSHDQEEESWLWKKLKKDYEEINPDWNWYIERLNPFTKTPEAQQPEPSLDGAPNGNITVNAEIAKKENEEQVSDEPTYLSMILNWYSQKLSHVTKNSPVSTLEEAQQSEVKPSDDPFKGCRELGTPPNKTNNIDPKKTVETKTTQTDQNNVTQKRDQQNLAPIIPAQKPDGTIINAPIINTSKEQLIQDLSDIQERISILKMKDDDDTRFDDITELAALRPKAAELQRRIQEFTAATNK